MKQTPHPNYFVTEDGKVYSDKSGNLTEMSRFPNKQGYLCVRVNGQSKVHRLVAAAYIGDVTGLTVNHLDGVKTNNCVGNLEIVTTGDNTRHAIQIGLIPLGEKHSRAKYSDSELTEALLDIKNGLSVNKVATERGISQSYLNKVKNGVYRKDLAIVCA